MNRIDKTRIRRIYPFYRQKPVYINEVTDAQLQLIVQTAVNNEGTIMIWTEIPQEIPDGQRTQFTLLYTPRSDSTIQLYLNGLLMEENVDFELTGKIIGFIAPPPPESTIQATYTKS